MGNEIGRADPMVAAAVATRIAVTRINGVNNGNMSQDLQKTIITPLLRSSCWESYYFFQLQIVVRCVAKTYFSRPPSALGGPLNRKCSC